MKSRLLGAVCASVFNFATLPANAALVSVDWKTAAANLLTRDDFGLEWLDLTETTDQAYNSITRNRPSRKQSEQSWKQRSG